jgi:hypothetical protein
MSLNSTCKSSSMLCRHGEVEHDVVAVSIVDQERERESGEREVERAGENQATAKREDPAGSC